ncbi:hypothetical protein EXIGLDRAFT_68752 [Exidia glandulosa HHB12029]|uniref:Uncharacterized protein n=1 Tax=Exidia glandulosa HHB12029 TaxID=1314781 RepID=A0A165I0G7_EXIGL|nr:hypothetical protein EXIGLDRAFT_68752 [Exidia glandulosa HHB12029]
MELAANATALLDTVPPWERAGLTAQGHVSPPSFAVPSSTPPPAKKSHGLGLGAAPPSSQHARIPSLGLGTTTATTTQHSRIPSLSKLPIASKHRRKENDENAAPAPPYTSSIPAPSNGTTRKASGGNGMGYRKPVPVASASQLAQALVDTGGKSAKEDWSAQVFADIDDREKERQRESEPGSPRRTSTGLGNLRASLRNSLGTLLQVAMEGSLTLTRSESGQDVELDARSSFRRGQRFESVGE